MKKKICIILVIILIAIIGIISGIYYIKEIQKEDKRAINSTENLNTINSVISNKMDNNQNKEEYSFYGKVIEASDSYIIVEPNEGEKIRKSADKISISLGKNNDALYMVGTNLKVTYNGTIIETYPAQVEAIKIELKSVENFEILFYDKQPQSDTKLHKIIDKNETDKYDYDVYVYDGSVNIRIDAKDYSLKEALLEDKIKMEEIIAKANQDERDEKIKTEMYKDGGSMEYHYENYTIIKCHSLDGNRDVYIGNENLKLTDIT